MVKTTLPVLLTVVRQIGQPRPPSLKGKMRAKKYDVPVADAAALGLDPADIGLAGSYTQVVKVFAPEMGGERRMFEGPAAQVGAQAIDALVDTQVIRLGE